MRISMILLATALLPLSACAHAPLQTAPAVSRDASYRLGAGDSLRVTVYGEDKLSGDYLVGDNGSVSLPLIGTVAARGKTVGEVGDAIAAGYRSGGFLTDPRVAVEVLAYRPFFILGEVQKAGQYPFIPGMTVRQAIATANGYTYRARQKVVFITHWGDSKEVAYRLDAGAMVAPGDTIRIPERHF